MEDINKKVPYLLLRNFFVLLIVDMVIIRFATFSTGYVLIIFCSTFAFYHLFLLFLYFYIIQRKKNRTYVQSKGENILIIVPHQDDCVAVAGGYAMQTLQKGGEVHLLYITDGYKDDKITRKQEAFDAWKTIGLQKERIHFLNYHNFTGLIERKELATCMLEIEKYIDQCKPDTIFVPSYEGGNYQHDVTNYMVGQIMKQKSRDLVVYEAPLYNFYFSFQTTPEKIFSGLLRLIPFVQYSYPPEPVRQDLVYYLRMSREQIGLKKEMLSNFKTQSPEKLIERFGFEDCFQKMIEYDYSKPPFNYDRTIAKKMNDLKSIPFLSFFASKVMRWTKTIHPDPRYTITRMLDNGCK